MKYFRIEDSFEIRNRWHLGDPWANKIELDSRLFTQCKEYLGKDVLDIPVEKGINPLDFTLGSFDMPVLTKNLGQMIESFATADVQRIPVRIGRFGEYEILNVLTLQNAIDEELSEISRWEAKDGRPEKVGKYFAIGELVLKRKQVNDAKIFRLKDWQLPLIICETIKQNLERLNTTGISFKELKSS